MLLRAGRLKRLIKQFSGYKSSTREVDLLMRRNKTSLTAHHFMSAPSDSLSHSFPVYLFVSPRHHQNASPRLLRPVFSFFLCPLSPACDRHFSTIYQPQPAPVRDGAFFFFFSELCMDRARSHSAKRLRGRHTKWDKHLVVVEEKLEVKSICSAAWRTLIPCHRMTAATRGK